MFRLPLTLTCKKLAHNDGTVLSLSCEVRDALGELVRHSGSFDVNVSGKSTFEELSSILQGYANSLARDLLKTGKAEKADVSKETEEDRMKDQDQIVDHAFIGVSS